ncbi:MAG: metal ABC transporter permease [Oscillospiraceae bacterium]|jgi:zinc transport system permease protein|nr:metal ABC transporter permease [Oscillospiraceae bacterium]
MFSFFAVFQYDFLWRALVVGLLVTLCSALLGVPLVLRRYSMIGDGLSHVGFGALAIAAALHWAPLPVAIPAVILAAFFLLRADNAKLRGDAAVALLSTGCLAVGVLAVSLGGSNADLMNYMFGSILALGDSDVYMSLALACVVLPGFAWFYHRVFSVTFDETFARATGIRTGWYQLLMAVLTSCTVVLGMRMLGTLLISSLVLFPALISMRVCKSFRGVALCSAAVAAACFLLGFWISCLGARGLPTGAAIVAVNLGAFGLFSLLGWLRARRRALHN